MFFYKRSAEWQFYRYVFDEWTLLSKHFVSTHFFVFWNKAAQNLKETIAKACCVILNTSILYETNYSNDLMTRVVILLQANNETTFSYGLKTRAVLSSYRSILYETNYSNGLKTRVVLLQANTI